MTKAFSLFLWENSPSVNTPLGESKLNLINRALDEVDSRIVNFDTTKANQSDLLTTLADVSYDESTGIFTFTKKNGAKTTVDTKLEKLAINFRYDKESQRLVITLDDGTIQYVDMKALITELEFMNSNTVLFSVSQDGKVSASIAKGSITADMLEPNYLANVQLYASQALTSADDAAKSAQEAEASAIRAEEAAEKAESIVGGDFAANEKVDNIISGTTTVGNSASLGGETSEAWQTKIDNTTAALANYLPKSGGTIDSDAVTALIINSKSSDSRAYISFNKSNAIQGCLGFNGLNTPVFGEVGGNNYPLLHTGNSAKVATSGSYNDLTDKPTIPTVGNGTITIKQAGASKGTFTMNQSGNTTIELTDDNTWRGIQNNLTSDSTTDSLSAAQGKVLKGLVDGKAASSHNQAASTISAGTLAGKVLANASAVATVADKQVRNIYGGTTDMTAGSTALATGDIYIVYE